MLYLQVLDMDELIKVKLATEQQKQVEQAREEATENAISVVTQRLKEAAEAEAAQQEATAGSDDAAEETAPGQTAAACAARFEGCYFAGFFL